MYIDVHCHLDKTTYGDLAQLIADCQKKGVGRIVTVGFDTESSKLCKEIAKEYECVYFTAGFHPTELGKYREGDLDIIRGLCQHEKCIALGEIGLDYHYPDTDKELQKELFTSQLRLAKELGVPVQIHSRDCAEDMLNILTQNKDMLTFGALMHCYSHSAEAALQFARLGLYFSFGGASTWKGSKRAKKSIACIPQDKLLTETDSPYMPPQSLYGSFPNTPLSIPEICNNMAEVRGVGQEQMKSVVWENARRLFKKLK